MKCPLPEDSVIPSSLQRSSAIVRLGYSFKELHEMRSPGALLFCSLGRCSFAWAPSSMQLFFICPAHGECWLHSHFENPSSRNGYTFQNAMGDFQKQIQWGKTGLGYRLYLQSKDCNQMSSQDTLHTYCPVQVLPNTQIIRKMIPTVMLTNTPHLFFGAHLLS